MAISICGTVLSGAGGVGGHLGIYLTNVPQVSTFGEVWVDNRGHFPLSAEDSPQLPSLSSFLKTIMSQTS